MESLWHMNNETVQLVEQKAEAFYQHSLSTTLLLIAISFYIVRAVRSSFGGVKAYKVGFRSPIEPAFLVRLRFSKKAFPIIKDGYSKFKNSMFKVLRNDADILVISNKYVDELRALPDEKASAISAHIKNLLGKYSTTTILLESDLHTKMLQTRLTPNLGSFVAVIKSELDFAMRVEIPECENKWTEVQIYEILLRIVARISARVFIGDPACRNEEWLQTSIKYTENVFTTVMILRIFPSYLHPIIALFLPSSWRVQSNLRTAQKIIIPMIAERRAEAAAGGEDYQKPNDLLQWMMEAANENDGQPHKLAHRQLLLSLASIHTTTMSAAHCLYDLCAHTEYFEPLREEAFEVMREDAGWKKTTLNKMRKLDSLLKESQRVNPPSLLAFNRIVKEPLTLSDGVQLPVGTHLSVASDSIMHDSDHLDNPEQYDAFRYYKKRLEDGEGNHHQFAMTDKNNLHFGHGKFSCPGRFFASNEIKIILAHLLLNYDFKYPAGQGRPVNLSADENLYPDPSARLLMRRRAPEQTPDFVKF